MIFSMSMQFEEFPQPLEKVVFQLQLGGGLEPWNFITFHSVGNVIIPADFNSIICSEG